MRLLLSISYWGPAPKPPGFSASFRQNGPPNFTGTRTACPLPFRPLSRSLGLLPSIALSRPTQVRSLSTQPVRYASKRQRTVPIPLTSCLTSGVHFN